LTLPLLPLCSAFSLLHFVPPYLFLFHFCLAFLFQFISPTVPLLFPSLCSASNTLLTCSTSPDPTQHASLPQLIHSLPTSNLKPEHIPSILNSLSLPFLLPIQLVCCLNWPLCLWHLLPSSVAFASQIICWSHIIWPIGLLHCIVFTCIWNFGWPICALILFYSICSLPILWHLSHSVSLLRMVMCVWKLGT